jgi:SAM-dependent methyltransferase
MSLAHRLSNANRMRKWALFQHEIGITPQMTVLDVGFSDVEFQPMDNYLEKLYPHLENITALGIDESKEFTQRYPAVKTVCYDGQRFPFDDQAFDVVWSNAVVEHVGDFDRQVFFLREIRRVGKRAFVTTPNRFFPVETHTRIPLLHFLPKPIFDALLKACGKSFFTGDYMHLSSESRFRRSLSAAGFSRFNLHKNRIGGFTVDFVAVA